VALESCGVDGDGGGGIVLVPADGEFLHLATQTWDKGRHFFSRLTNDGAVGRCGHLKVWTVIAAKEIFALGNVCLARYPRGKDCGVAVPTSGFKRIVGGFADSAALLGFTAKRQPVPVGLFTAPGHEPPDMVEQECCPTGGAGGSAGLFGIGGVIQGNLVYLWDSVNIVQRNRLVALDPADRIFWRAGRTQRGVRALAQPDCCC